MKSVRKTKFGGLNDKRFYFHDGIAPLPFRLALLEKTREEKEKQKWTLYINSKENAWLFSNRSSSYKFMWKIKGIKINIYSATNIIFTKFTSVGKI